MLYMIGTLQLDTYPFGVDKMNRVGTADLAQKAVVAGMAPSEFMGDGGEQVTLSGQLLPFKLGGLTELEIAHQMRREGARVPVMRGDGFRLGTFAITRVSEDHANLMRDGVGFTVRHSITLRKVQADTGSGLQVIQGLVNLFEALGG